MMTIPETNLGRIVRECQRDGLILGPNGIKLLREEGYSLWQDGDLVEGPSACDECCDEFDIVDNDEQHPGQVVVTSHVLEIDFRDADEPDDPGDGPEKRHLCTFCADCWAKELAGFEVDEPEKPDAHRVRQALIHLKSAQSQMLESDDEIIRRHVDSAVRLLEVEAS